MFQSFRYSNIFLRLGLAFVFLWFGIDKFFDPTYWLQAWVPQSVSHYALNWGIQPNDLVYAVGVFETLVGISLLGNLFVPLFSGLAIIFLLAITLFHGFNEVIVRDVGLIGGLLSLLVWPRQRKLFL